MSQTLDNDLINVAIRIRPFLPRDNQCKALQIIDSEPPSIVVEAKELQYCCDHVFNENASQDVIFNEIVCPNIKELFAGQNCTIFAYGQTGTGKTFTMGTDPNSYFGKDSGIVPKTLERIYAHKLDDNTEAQIYISFVEIYNEKAYDLLTNNKVCLQMKGYTLQNMNVVHVKDASEASKWLTIGSQNRHIGETKLNSKSSRSHAIFTLYCKIRDENCELNSKLHLVDLAGSECVKRTGNEGVQFQESVNINKGLFYVGQVIKALSSNTMPPYRESTLTKILHDSLTNANRVSLIACVSPSIDDLTETVATLDFAKKIKQIKNGFRGSHFDSQTKITTSGTIKRTYSYVNNSHSTLKARRVLSYRTPKQRVLNNVPFSSSRYLSRVPEQSSCQSLQTSNMSLASISTIAAEGGQNLSPFVKRCADALEVTLMSKIETLMKNQLQGAKHLEQQSTPVYWKKLESKVQHLIRNEMKQARNYRSPKACSSPKMEPDEETFVEDDFETKRTTKPQQLDFSDITNITADGSCEERNNASLTTEATSFEFTAPLGLPKRATKPTKRDVSLCNAAPPRRSARISVRKSSVVVSPVTAARRKSTRVAQRKSLQKSIELQKTVKKVKPLSQKQSKILRDHENGVLQVLNEGNLQQLKKLATIGPKTAIQLVHYRNLVGKFRSIKDMKKLPNWKGYSKFLAGNFLNGQ